MLNLILFGPPGCGKGTQSELLSEKYGLIHLSTGYILREEIEKKTTLGLEAKKHVDQGHLVPDPVVIGMIDSAITNNPQAKGFLFDGYPRTVAQAQALDALLQQKGAEISLVLALQVGTDELVSRLINRGKTSGRSDDTDESIIRARLQEYDNKTAAVEGYYEQSGKVQRVKGEGTIDEIFAALCDEVEAVRA